MTDRDPRSLTRADFDGLDTVTTRWADNDMFGHLNNAVYLELFDSVLNDWLVRGTGIDESTAPAQGVVAESTVRYFAEVSYPGSLEVGVRVARVGRTSAVLELGLFAPGSDTVAAHCTWVQVYVDSATRRPTPLPDAVRSLLERTLASQPSPG
jgi:acyl-CoA thioester hydrolase